MRALIEMIEEQRGEDVLEYNKEVFRVKVQDVTVVTEAAILVRTGAGSKSWIQKYAIHPSSEVVGKSKGESGWLVIIAEWGHSNMWAEKHKVRGKVGYPQWVWDKMTVRNKARKASGDKARLENNLAESIYTGIDPGDPKNIDRGVEFEEVMERAEEEEKKEAAVGKAKGVKDKKKAKKRTHKSLAELKAFLVGFLGDCGQETFKTSGVCTLLEKRLRGDKKLSRAHRLRVGSALKALEKDEVLEHVKGKRDRTWRFRVKPTSATTPKPTSALPVKMTAEDAVRALCGIGSQVVDLAALALPLLNLDQRAAIFDLIKVVEDTAPAFVEATRAVTQKAQEHEHRETEEG